MFRYTHSASYFTEEMLDTSNCEQNIFSNTREWIENEQNI